MISAERALRQITLPNAPKLKFFDTVDLYHKAAKCFSIAGEWEESSNAYAKAATFMVKLNKPHEGAVFWLKSAEMIRRVDPLSSMEPYDTAAKLYVGIGRFATAANITRDMAEMLEEFK
jgi:alpha-soluble NSF attachment protein